MSLLSFHPTPAQRLCTRTVVTGYRSQQRVHDDVRHIPSLDRSDQGTFEAAGIQHAIAASLRVAFPNVQKPTAMQRKLIRGIASNRDVLLQDDTGTGKSFAAMLVLLSKPPARKINSERLTGLLIVPHRDLAYQYLHWIHHMTLPEGDTPFSLTKYAQVLVRHADRSALQNLPVRMQEAIRSAPTNEDLLTHKLPRILIATPNVILELMERQPEVFRLAGPSTIVVDEVDALLPVPDSKLTRERRKVSRKKLEKHIPDLVRVLNRLYAQPKGSREDEKTHPHLLGGSEVVPAGRPQLVMISATLRSRFQSALFSAFGWLQRGEVLKLIRKGSAAVPAHRLGRSAIHHVLVVSKTGDIKNMAGALPLQSDDTSALKKEVAVNDNDEEGIFYDDDEDPELRDDVDRELLHSPLAFDPATLEAVAATFALDVPRVALLVLPATAAVRKVIFELRQLGVNAHPFDLVGNEASRRHVLSRTADEVSDENPMLIVATLATVRGVDLPDLSHVFILGVPEGRAGDAYLHVAGRVGRFGKRGKVITVLEEQKEERIGNKAVVRDAPRQMSVLLSRLGIAASRLGHFE